MEDDKSKKPEEDKAVSSDQTVRTPGGEEVAATLKGTHDVLLQVDVVAEELGDACDPCLPVPDRDGEARTSGDEEVAAAQRGDTHLGNAVYSNPSGKHPGNVCDPDDDIDACDSDDADDNDLPFHPLNCGCEECVG